MSKDEDYEDYRKRMQISYSFDNFDWNQFVQPKSKDYDMQKALTELELAAMDLLEHDVEKSQNQQAREMLAKIGITCDDKAN